MRHPCPVLLSPLALAAALLCGAARAEEALVAPVAGRPAGAAAAVERLCGSPLPVVVIDHFVSGGKVRPYMDVDGDGVPEAAHGEVVAALYEARGRRVLRLDLGGDNSLEKVAELLVVVFRWARAGRRVAAVNVSQNVDVTLEAVNRDLGLSGVDAASIGPRRSEVLAAMVQLMREQGAGGLDALVSAARALAASGVPIFFSAGNQGAGKVNLLGLLPGVVSVGALARGGEKAGFSADNSLVELWASGEHVARRVAGGVDLNRDGRGDFGNLALSGGAPFVARYAGRPVAEAVRPLPSDDPFLDSISRESEGGLEYLRGALGEHLYKAEDLAVFFRLDPARRRSLLSRGAYFDATLRYPFDAADGRLVFDPEKSGAANQVLLITGTSFAPAALCR